MSTGSRSVELALGHRDLSWLGRVRACLCEVGRPDLAALVVPTWGRGVLGGAHPDIVGADLVAMSEEDLRLLNRARELALADWPYHPTFYPRGRPCPTV